MASLPGWFVPWMRWKIVGGTRPRGAPERIPDWAQKAHAWFVPWGRWVMNGRPATHKPRQIPRGIPEWANTLLAMTKVAEKLQQLGSLPIPNSQIPDLGPITADGPSILDYDLTHATGGLPGYPAFDAAFTARKTVLAPEDLTVTRHSSARRRDGRPNGRAFYATGESGIGYWFGHVEDIPDVGAKIRKGGSVGHVSPNHEAPHLHVGVDAWQLLGRELRHHTDYTHGAPTIRDQLEAI